MGICNFIDVYGAFPQDCAQQEQWISDLVDAIPDNWRCGSGATSDPADAVLNALFSPCTVPDPAWVIWIDTTVAIYPVASLWSNCGAATDWDSDGDTIVDRTWLPMTGAVRSDQHFWNDVGSTGTSAWTVMPGNPTVSITSRGNPIFVGYSVNIDIELWHNLALAGGTNVQTRLMQNGVATPTLGGLAGSVYNTMHSSPVGTPGAGGIFDQHAAMHAWQAIYYLPPGTYTYTLQWRLGGYFTGRLASTGFSAFNTMWVQEL